MLNNLINILFIITIAQSSDTQVRFLKNMTVSQGQYNDRIIVQWDKTQSESYTVMRSQFKTGEFTAVTQTADVKYEDTAVEKGVRYWYKIVPSTEIETVENEEIFITNEEYNSHPENNFTEAAVNKTNAEEPDKKEAIKEITETTDPGKTDTETKTLTNPSFSYSGYTSIENPSGIKLNNLLKLKKVKLKTPADAQERKKQKEDLDYLKQHYMNPVKLTLFMTIAKPFLEKEELIIFNDLEIFEIKPELKQVLFYDKNYNYMIVFESGKFLRIISEKGEKELTETLLKNSELFCISSGKSFIVDTAGVTRLVNTFDAVGITTGYLKNDSEWKSRTIMLATARPDLKEKMKNISKKE